MPPIEDKLLLESYTDLIAQNIKLTSALVDEVDKIKDLVLGKGDVPGMGEEIRSIKKSLDRLDGVVEEYRNNLQTNLEKHRDSIDTSLAKYEDHVELTYNLKSQVKYQWWVMGGIGATMLTAVGKFIIDYISGGAS